MSQVTDTSVEAPAGLPAQHIVEFDYFNPPGMQEKDVHDALKWLHEDNRPDVLWSPLHGGHWIISRADDIRWARAEAILFSHEEFLVPRGLFNRILPPVNVDPPYHARFRMLFNPALSPRAIAGLERKARDAAIELIEQIKPDGHCDFVPQFGRVMPVLTFLHLLGLPTERRDQFIGWAQAFINARDQATKDAAAADIERFLLEVLDDREANPRDDLFSRIVGWRKSPHYKGEFEVIGMAMAAFLGGLDTVSGVMAFTMRHLAVDPDLRRRLIDDPSLISRAVEESLRRHGLSMTARVLTDDVSHKGVTMRRGDMVLLVDALAGLDERAYPNPTKIDIDREPLTHDAFGNSVHKCVGEHLARMELNVMLEEWMKRIPDFRLDPNCPARTYSGVVIGMDQLGLRWDNQQR